MSRPEERPARASATSRLRMWGYAAVLTAFCFAQSAGRMVADTKFDLVTDPGKFLTGGLHLWDPSAAFGQLQNQAYGYAWPMGPFFWLGDLVHLPPWVVQRLWWSLLLCLAFVGIVRLAQRLGLGSPVTQVVAGFAFVLTPRITTLLGGVSVEVWPMAIAPWVLLPLVAASERGSVRRGAALSALAVATCGGVNAVAVAAVLPLGLLWILTRAGGPRKWRLLGWWVLFTGLATAWWSGPLLLLGRYSPPFLDYIENATITTVPTGLARTLLGTSDWVAYFAGIDYPAGQHLVTTPFLMVDAAGVAALGLVGVLLRSNPHQRFLTLGLLVGVTLVGFGYSGDLAGWWAADRTGLLDGALAPFRNLHKFDVVLRIPLVLGVAHALHLIPRLLRGPGARPALRALQVATALALVALALPWAQDEIAPRNGVEAVPRYWSAAADYLAEEDDGTVALELPASAFGVYDWGNVHDDVMQGLAQSPWAVRNVIPLAPPGNVVFLDAVTRAVESGRPSDTLAAYLAANGVGRIVVRNDLARFQTGSPDPAYVRSVLTASEGITPARSFGPRVGSGAWTTSADGGTRLVTGNGLAARTGSIDVYDVDPPAGARLTTDPQVLMGDPGSGLRAGLAGPAQRVLAEDASGDEAGLVLTDGARRRETNFAAVRWNRSATMSAGEPYRLNGPEHSHRFLADPARWQTTAVWTGDVSAVTSTSSEAYADALPPLQIGSHPGAALDGDPSTAWRSARQVDPTGQWWQVTFGQPTDVAQVRVTLSRDSAPVPRLRLGSGEDTLVVAAPAPGRSRTYRTGFTDTSVLRVTAAGRDLRLPGSFGLAEVEVPGVQSQRYLQLPRVDDRYPLDTVSLTRDPDRAACVKVGHALPCDDALVSPGEDGDVLARRFTPAYAEDYELSGTVSLRRTTDGRRLLLSGASATASGGRPADVAEGPLAAVDGNLATTWVTTDTRERLHVELGAPRVVRELRVRLNPAAAASMPSRLQVRAEGRTRVLDLDEDGRARLPGWRTDSLDLRVLTTEPAFSVVGQQFVEMPAGISGLRVNRESLAPQTAVPRSFGCGSGPTVRVGDQVLRTRLQASTRALVRGESVPFEVCGDPDVSLDARTTDVLAAPSHLFRVDSLELHRTGATTTPTTRDVPVTRDERGEPVSVAVPERSSASLLTVPQNVNDGWVATWQGQELTPQRVDGWKQGWRLPAGAAGDVQLTFRPAGTFSLLLAGGAVLVGACLLVVVGSVLRARRSPARRELPALDAGRPGLLDLAVAVLAGGLLCGWWGLAGVLVATAAGLGLRRFQGWPLLAGLTLLVGSLALSWSAITDRSWAVGWSQAWSLAAICLAVAALAGLRRNDAHPHVHRADRPAD
ncbi:alpha-(1-_3)-arabinofuranosyltransferase domain-containing protein [Nocardioides sp. MAHUQ-72]|uniref:alpha-(1->3)-arabinofuranosyltransferase domain-containing protein n=1 Tax=unclassified Nocardioides TaxID=2615069 RepID=UPI00362186D3